METPQNNRQKNESTKMKKTIVLLLLLVVSTIANAQKAKDFFYAEPETKSLPVFVRGDVGSKKIILYVQGGDAENGIDFGRSDYPKWKNSLETKVAIAYFDQRGLNMAARKIDTSKINTRQVSKDIIAIAKALKEKYNAEIHLMGHSLGGQDVLKCLAEFPEETSFIQSGIVLNTPITTDFSPERYTTYRPEYLKNIAKGFLEKKIDTAFWKEAYDWMEVRDSISTIEDSKTWNYYVDNAFSPAKRKIGLGMVFKVIFSRPYNPIKYLNQKDNQLVGDKLWDTEKTLWDSGKQTTLWELLPKIEHSVFLLTGRYDAIAVPEEMTAANGLIKNSELLILPNSGHESFLDRHNAFTDAVLAHLKINTIK